MTTVDSEDTPAQASKTGWEHFEHQADVGVRGIGRTRAEAFEQAARALTAIVTDLDKVAAQESMNVECSAPDDELLFVEWLNALVYEMATRGVLFSEFSVAIEDHCLTATATGEPVDVKRHQPAVEVKAATCTALAVHQRPDGLWLAQCVLDV